MKLFFMGVVMLVTNFSFAIPLPINLCSICSKSNKKIKINPHPFKTKNNTEPVNFVLNKSQYQFICFIDLNKDDKQDIVAYEPSATGTSNEQFYTFFVNCGNDYYIPVLTAYGRKFYIKRNLVCDHIVLESWNAKIDSMGVTIDKHFRTYAFDGEGTFRKMSTELVFENKDILIEEIPDIQTSSVLPRTPINTNFIKKRQDSNRIDIELKNQEILTFTSVKRDEIMEGTSHYELIQYYTEIDYVLFRKESWEIEQYVLVSLENGATTILDNYPIFSKSQKKFCVIENRKKKHSINKKLAIYTIEYEKINLPFTIEIDQSFLKNEARKFSLKVIDWVGEVGFRAIQTIDNGIQDVDREVMIWLKKDF